MNETIDALLLLSTAERTVAGITHPRFVLLTLVTEVVSLLEVLGEERGVRILLEHVELAELELQVDRNLMRIALMNVLHNALKFSPEQAEVSICFSYPLSSRIQIAIQDQGGWHCSW